MHVLLLTFAMASRLLPGQAAVHHWTPVTAIAIVATSAAGAEVPTLVDQQAPQPPQINVEVNRGGRGWYANPVWMAIGAIALVVVILLIVMAARGGGTTIVRE